MDAANAVLSIDRNLATESAALDQKSDCGAGLLDRNLLNSPCRQAANKKDREEI